MHSSSNWKNDSLEGLLFAGTTVGLYYLPPNVIETYYSNGVFPYIARAEGFVGDLVPFSLFDGFIIGGSVYFAFVFGRAIVRNVSNIFRKKNLESHLDAMSDEGGFANSSEDSNDDFSSSQNNSSQKPSRFQRFKNYLHSKFVDYCGAFKRISQYALVLTLMGGLNSARVPVIEKVGLQANAEIKLEELVHRINEKKKVVGDFVFNYDFMNPDFADAVNKSVGDAYQLVNKTEIKGPLKFKTSAVLPSMIGGVTLLSFDSSIRLHHSFFPFWVMGHEKAHTKGYLLEKDAEALNYVACLNSGNDMLEYCSMLQLFLLSSIHLSANETDRVKNAFKQLDPSVLRDFGEVPEVSDSSKVVLIAYDAVQKLRGQKNTFNAYVTEVVPVLWAIDDAYRNGDLRVKNEVR